MRFSVGLVFEDSEIKLFWEKLQGGSTHLRVFHRRKTKSASQVTLESEALDEIVKSETQP